MCVSVHEVRVIYHKNIVHIINTLHGILLGNE